MSNISPIRQYAVDTIKIEAAAVANLINLLTDDFDRAVEAIIACTGKVIVTGMGKSGLIGKKIAATLASTGTPSFFLHPGEAYHGDLGMISPNDVVLAIANSGQTDEILKLIPFIEHQGNVLISMTGNPDSTLARHSHYHLSIAVACEACPMNLAPTSSTTATLVMGDALAVALMKVRDFKAEDYAVYHPGGSLGRRLLTRVRDVMRSDGLPLVPATMTLGDVIIAISDARMGIAVIVDPQGHVEGVITDGDVRRAMAKYKQDFFNISAGDIMSRNPKTIGADERIVVAEDMMRRYKIHSIVVVDGEKPVGVVEYFNVSFSGEQSL
ncbi:MAG: KpsF/GutQ family sugar-phosphate isomerase [Rikenellaceae bacterium]|jgi:arabinose-5-phosphate isomerase|nr:KpsF/GutQ family sugar-phosphate isomerase [Rikenellaceae bacterium]